MQVWLWKQATTSLVPQLAPLPTMGRQQPQLLWRRQRLLLLLQQLLLQGCLMMMGQRQRQLLWWLQRSLLSLEVMGVGLRRRRRRRRRREGQIGSPRVVWWRRVRP